MQREITTWIQLTCSCNEVIFTVNAVISICFQMYMKSRLNCILLHSTAFLKPVDSLCLKEDSDDDIQIIEDDCDDLFDNMEIVEEFSPRKRCKLK
jgi:hypothetical protein